MMKRSNCGKLSRLVKVGRVRAQMAEHGVENEVAAIAKSKYAIRDISKVADFGQET